MSTQPVIVSAETIRSVIQDYFAASRGNNKVEGMVACFAEDCVNQDPVGGPILNGQAEVHQFFQAIVELFATLELTEEFMSINGQEAAVKWSGYGMGKNGSEVSFEGIDVFEVNSNGKIQSIKGYWNPAAMLAKLGVS